MTDTPTPYPIPLAKEMRRGLWPFSQRLYAEPGVESLCLHLQDEQNADVLLLLWCAWLEMRELPLSPALLAEAVDMLTSQSEPTVVQLRAVRRFVKAHDMLPQAIEKQVRENILSAELAIEKQLLLELEALVAEARPAANDDPKSGRVLPLELLVQHLGLVAAGEWLGSLRASARQVYSSEDRL